MKLACPVLEEKCFPFLQGLFSRFIIDFLFSTSMQAIWQMGAGWVPMARRGATLGCGSGLRR